MRLEIELIPKSTWYKNVRTSLTKTEWDKVRKACYRKAGYKCEICGDKGEDWPVECHEVWEFNDKKKIQKLIRLIALCPKCHIVKHLGRSRKMGNFDIAIEHFCKVNNVSIGRAEIEIDRAFKLYNERSLWNWEIDISKVKKGKANGRGRG